jgi:hypothetical protein
MKRYEGGIVRGRKQTFGIVRVEPEVLANREEAIKTAQSMLPLFDGLPVVLVAEKEGEKPLYFARPDLMKFLMDFHLPSVDWKEYTL